MQSREEKNAKERERYATDPEYRRHVLDRAKTWKKAARFKPAYDPDRSREYNARWRAKHPKPKKLGPPKPKKWTKEYRREYMREYMRERYRDSEVVRAEYAARHQRNPIITLGGERYRLNALEPELRPIAEMIRETRQEIRRRHA